MGKIQDPRDIILKSRAKISLIAGLSGLVVTVLYSIYLLAAGHVRYFQVLGTSATFRAEYCLAFIFFIFVFLIVYSVIKLRK